MGWAHRSIRHQSLRIIRNVVGANRYEAFLDKARWAAYKKAGVVFVHIPRAAGSSISTALYGRRLGHRNFEDLFSAREAFPLPSFCVIRDPFSRLLSAYYYALRGGTASGLVEYRPEYSSEMFGQFPRFVREYLIETPSEDLDYVFRPQVDFVCNRTGSLGVDHVFSLGHTTQLVDWLRGFGVSSLPRLNAQGAQGEVNIDPETRVLIEGHYQKDFSLWSEHGE